MDFSPPLQACRFLSRWKRFLAMVELPDGSRPTVHVPNSGSMITCLREGAPALISCSSNPARKLAHTLEMVADEAGWIVVNTLRANAMAREALEGCWVPGLGKDWIWRAEARRGASRLDFLGSRGSGTCWVEVKSVTLRLEGGWAAFPDSVTLRGRKHLDELRAIAEEGDRALLLLIVQRQGLHAFRPAEAIDPAWAAAMRRAVESGVEVCALQVVGDAAGLRVAGRLPCQL